MATQNRPSFWKRTGGKLVIAASIIATIAALLDNLTSISNFVKNLFGPDKGVQVVDLTVDDTTTATTPPNNKDSGLATSTPYQVEGVNFKDQNTMEVQLRNNGNENASLKRLDLVIKKKWIIKPKINTVMRLVPSTASYDITVDLRKDAPLTIPVRVRHDIPSMDSELFTLLVNGKRQDRDDNTYVYLADVKIIFNETSEAVSQPNIFFGFQRYPLPDVNNASNKRNVREIREQAGEKSAMVTQLLNSFP